jgi:hypothetical protein
MLIILIEMSVNTSKDETARNSNFLIVILENKLLI